MFSQKNGSSANARGSNRQSAGSSRSSGATPATSNESLEQAIRTLTWALETLGVERFGLIGGGAIFALSTEQGLDPRITEDVDLLILPTGSMNAEIISSLLTTDDRVKGYFVVQNDGYIDKPYVKVHSGRSTTTFAIEIFDHEVWPRRQKYYDLSLPENAPKSCALGSGETQVLNTPWLLRQKIMTYAQRANKRATDMLDIDRLYTIMETEGIAMEIVDEDEIECLRTVISSRGAPALHEVVLCEALYPTSWTWNDDRNDYFKYNEGRQLVWRSNYQE